MYSTYCMYNVLMRGGVYLINNMFNQYAFCKQPVQMTPNMIIKYLPAVIDKVDANIPVNPLQYAGR